MVILYAPRAGRRCSCPDAAQFLLSMISGGDCLIPGDHCRLSGLCVDALNDAPGVYSARFCGHHGDDEANNEKLLQEMQNVPDARRTARFVSAICVALTDGTTAVWHGECHGRIAHERKGDNGFGYDPLFIPDFVGKDLKNTENLTYAQLTAEQKDAISHRGAALAEMEKELVSVLEHAVNSKE